ncbi:hypothetical protein [Lentzea sp. NPDC051838]|uniref:hypothetical protein n=1 Tax=Lentzea sp. NPDC051838 TaxID=3154849 RepID=UPI00341E2370
MDFMSNTPAWATPAWVESVREEGVVREPFAYSRAALVHEADIGAVAAAVLTRGGHGGATLRLTGPEALTVPQQVAAISAATGRDVRYAELSEDEARVRMLAEGRPARVADFLIRWKRDMPAEGYTVVSTVEDVLGRPARSFALWAEEHAGRFISGAGTR